MIIDERHPLLLGSASPRRREILASLGIPVLLRPVSVDETPQAGERPDGYLERVVAGKLDAVGRLAPEELGQCAAVLVADTIVVEGDAILGKPRDEAEARVMLRRLSGRAHRVATRFAVASGARPGHALCTQTVDTEVVFRLLSDEEVSGYAATREGLDKAGAYAIQGIGAFAVERVAGSYSNVVGLPACEVVLALRRAGLLGPFPLPARAADGAGP
ncbi:MAG: septum formation protein Maf [Deltaproteobacteria bacterium]|nr:septum formation protein Maf [Deltaproteobacteria bacterium]